MSEREPMPLVDSPAGLASVLESACAARVVALDTEFVWERTYYPRLGLVQLGLDRENVFLIDAAALDLTPLGSLLADPRITKVLHDAGQDLTILSRATGAQPRSIFDTQLAAGFVGLTATLSLQALVRQVIDVHLPKGATRSDWLQRPLSDEQLEYAREDVRYLPELHAQLRARLDAAGRARWAEEEMGLYDQPHRFSEDDPRDRYLHTKGRGKRGFGGREYAVLREVAAWREELARAQDRPRQHVMNDDALITVAQRKPTSEEQLARLNLPPPVRSKARSLLDAVERALELPRDAWPDKDVSRPDDPAVTPRLDLVQAVLRGHGERDGIDPQILANRAEVERLVSSKGPERDASALLSGWRAEYIGTRIEALLQGRAFVAIDSSGLPVLRTHDDGR